MSNLSPKFRQTITDVFAERGEAWLDNLPALLDEYAARWSLRLLPPFALSYNYVAPAVRSDGAEVVIKAGVPNPELINEIAALRVYDGRGAVQLLDADVERGVFLLERLQPATTLAELASHDDEQATLIAAQVMQQVWRPAPADHGFPTVQRWGLGFERLRRRYNGGTGPLPAPLVEQAERLFADLIRSMDAPVVLHGDLHHENIIAAQRAPWLAIDPKGVVGEPAYEIGALLRNQLPASLDVHEIRRLSARRIDQLSEALGFDRQRLIRWGMAQAVLSEWWTVEDHGHIGGRALAVAEALAGLVEG